MKKNSRNTIPIIPDISLLVITMSEKHSSRNTGNCGGRFPRIKVERGYTVRYKRHQLRDCVGNSCIKIQLEGGNQTDVINQRLNINGRSSFIHLGGSLGN